MLQAVFGNAPVSVVESKSNALVTESNAENVEERRRILRESASKVLKNVTVVETKKFAGQSITYIIAICCFLHELKHYILQCRKNVKAGRIAESASTRNSKLVLWTRQGIK